MAISPTKEMKFVVKGTSPSGDATNIVSITGLNPNTVATSTDSVWTGTDAAKLMALQNAVNALTEASFEITQVTGTAEGGFE